ncbi:Putative E3 ubiquitin-protein ligase [Hypoxylon texense]
MAFYKDTGIPSSHSNLGVSSLPNSALTGTVSRPLGCEADEDALRSASSFVTECCSITIHRIKINQVTSNQGTDFGFTLSFTVTISGPAASMDFALSEMPVDVYGPAGRFGFIVIPGKAFIATPTPSGDGRSSDVETAKVSFEVVDLPGRVTDPAAFYPFILYLLYQQTVPLSLQNGRAKLSAKAAGFDDQPVTFRQAMTLPAMDWPGVSVDEVVCGTTLPTCRRHHRSAILRHEEEEKEEEDQAGTATATATANNNQDYGDNGTAITVRLRIDSRASSAIQLSIDLGTCHFEVRNGAGQVFARLRGRLEVASGLVALAGEAFAGVRIPEGRARLVGRYPPDGDFWSRYLLDRINLPIRDVWKLRRCLDDNKQTTAGAETGGGGTAIRHH